MNKGYAAFELGPRHVRSVDFEPNVLLTSWFTTALVERD
jgi:hypothetical protein